MRMISEAIEGARDFRGMMDKIEDDAAQQKNILLMQAALRGDTQDERRYIVQPDRQPGENRAAHRARLKRERREVGHSTAGT